jgi:hypothetical protein
LKPPDYEDTPSITFKSLSKSTVFEDSTVEVNDTMTITYSDSLLITLAFTDGDGDLGPTDPDDAEVNIFLTDSRDGSVKPYVMPLLTPDGSVRAISGEITIAVTSFACQPGVDENKFRYSIKIKDRAGHESNSVEPEEITSDCQD